MIPDIDNAALRALCQRYHVRRLDLFGSAARGEAANDVDFLVEFEDFLDGGYAQTYFGLLEALQALVRRPVDLVVDSAVRNPYFRRSIERDRTPLYAA